MKCRVMPAVLRARAGARLLRGTVLGVMISLALALCAPTADAGALFFSEPFDGPGVGPNLEDADGAFVVSGGVVRKVSTTFNEDRRYVRTVRTDYRSNDWVYTIEFDTRGTGFEIVFIGVGEGVRNSSSNNEPGNAAFFRIHSKSVVDGRIDVAVMRTGQAGFDALASIGSLPANGVFTARIEKTGSQLAFSIDGVTGVQVIAVPGFLDDTSSRLFFGNSNTVATHDNMVVQELSTVLTVSVDIKPDGTPNSINPRNRGVIPVAILTTDDFDATAVDAATVRFGRTGSEAAAVHSALEDANGDGYTDMVLHFRTQETGIQCGDTSASLTGQTVLGQSIEGVDTVRTTGCK